MTIISQKSFSRGILSRNLLARPDILDYVYGVRDLVNFTVTKEGVAESRPGLTFVDECRSPSTTKRLIPFVFSTSTGDTYTLEFGDSYMEVIRAGGRVTETAKTITGATQADPCVITIASHGYSNGDHLILTGIGGMVELNNRRVVVANQSTNTFEIQDTSGTDIDSTGFTAYTSGGSAAEVYNISTPYAEADLQALKFAQSADVMTITHPDYAVRELSRTGHTAWTLTTWDQDEALDGAGVNFVASGTAGAAGSGTYRYRITVVATPGWTPFDSFLGECPPGYELGRSLTAGTNASPAVLTSTAHGYSAGDEVFIEGLSGNWTPLNNKTWLVGTTTANTFQVLGSDSSAYGSFTGSDPKAYRTSITISSAAAPTATAPHVLSVTGVQSIRKFNVYRELNGAFGYIGTIEYSPDSDISIYTQTHTFKDVGVIPNTADGPPNFSDLFGVADDYPSCVAYHQQRRVFANSDNDPETVWASELGLYSGFNYREPIFDTDRIEFTVNSQEVNPIKHLVPLRRLVILTGSQEWVVQGNQAGTITPSEVNANPYTNQGSSEVRPAIVDNDVIYIQARGNSVRNLYYNFGEDTYGGEDLSTRASHLLRGHSVRDMAYAKVPDSTVWIVRDDGALLGLTYYRREQVVAWHRHEAANDGLFEQVAAIPENDSEDVGGEDAVYAVVKRVVDGRTVRHIERMKARVVDQDVRDRYTWLSQDGRWQHERVALDSFLSYDGYNTGAVTITLSTAGGWTTSDDLTATASSSTFLSTDVGTAVTSRKFFIWDADGSKVVLRVTGYTSGTAVTVRADRTVPASLQSTARNTWAAAVRRVTGLNHIEGEDVSAVGDGEEAANAYTDGTAVTVSGGKADFTDFYATLHVGLPYKSDIELLDIENPEGRSFYSLKKRVLAAGAYVKDSFDFYVGVEFPDADAADQTSGLKLATGRDEDDEEADLPRPMLTQYVEAGLRPQETDHGRAVLRNVSPTPITVLAMTRTAEVTDNGS